MLTKDDFNALNKLFEKKVRKVVREEIEAEGTNIRNELSSDIRDARMTIQIDIRELSSRVKNVEIVQIALKKGQQIILKKIDKAIGFLDRYIVHGQKRLDRVEDKLKLPRLPEPHSPRN